MKKLVSVLSIILSLALCIALLTACSDSSNNSSSKPHEHTLDYTPTLEATCTTDGHTEYWYCSGCDKYFSDKNAENEIDLSSTITTDGEKHSDLVFVNSKAPTCTENGRQICWYCNGCAKYFLDADTQIEIQYSETVVPAKAHKNKTYFPYLFDGCDKDNNHIEYWYCSDCDKYFSDVSCQYEIIKTDEQDETLIYAHPYIEYHGRTDATCEKDGNIEYWYCPDCDKYFSDSAFEKNIPYSATIVNKLDHSHCKFVQAKASDCDNYGNIKYWYCPDCDKYFSDIYCKNEITQAETLTHKHPKAENVPAFSDCIKTGNISYWSCSDCGKCFSDELCEHEIYSLQTQTAPLNHRNAVKLTAKAATCVENGITCDCFYCPDCDTYFGDEDYNNKLEESAVITDKLSHNVVKTSAAPSACATEGNIEYWHCSDCGKYFSDNSLSTEISYEDTVVTKHPLKIYREAVAADTENYGSREHWYCPVCQKYFSDKNCNTEIKESGIAIISDQSCVFRQQNEGYRLDKYTGTARDVIIAPNFNGLPIVAIGNDAFKDCSFVTSISIPDTVTNIGNNAFEGCIGLIEMVLPESVTSIGAYAFAGCKYLTSVNIPKEVDYIDEGLFSDCGLLAEINIPSSATLQKKAFYKCSKLTEITLPSTLENIPDSLFYECGNLAKIDIPSSVKTIESYAFYGCKKLDSIDLPSSLTAIGDFAFYGCEKATYVTLPAKTDTLGTAAFSGCSSLSSLTVTPGNTKYRSVQNCIIDAKTDVLVLGCVNSVIPFGGTVKTIGAYAFAGSGIVSPSIPDSVTYIDDCAFADCKAMTSIFIPDSLDDFGCDIFKGCDKMSFTEYNNGLYLGNKENPYRIFFGIKDPEVTHCTFNPKCRIIAKAAFRSCKNLLSVDLTSEVEKIPDYAFAECDNLNSVIVSPSVTTIGKSAFYNCYQLENITLYNGLEKVENDAFYKSYTISLNALKINFVGTLEDWCHIIFINEHSNPLSIWSLFLLNGTPVNDLIIPSSITAIGNYQFYGFAARSIDLSADSVQRIGMYAFYGHAALTITLPDSVTFVDERAFASGSDNLVQISLGKNLIGLGNSAFNSSNLTEIIDHSNLAELNDPEYLRLTSEYNLSVCQDEANSRLTFKNGFVILNDNKKILIMYSGIYTDIEIPEGVEEIRSYAFKSSDITSVVIPDSVVVIHSAAFFSCSSLNKVTLGKNVTIIESQAFNSCDNLVEIHNRSSLELSIGSTDNGDIAVAALDIYTDEKDRRISVDSNGFTFYTDESNRILIKYSGTRPNVVIPTGVTKIHQQAFSGNQDLISITIPNSVTEIGYCAFSFCTNLASVSFGQNIASIGGSAFSYCYSLKSIELPSSLTFIDMYAFNECVSLTTVVMPDSIETIAESAFENCNNLKYTVYGNGNYLGNADNPYVVLMSPATSSKSMTVNEKCKIINGLTGRVEEISVPASVKYIGSGRSWEFNRVKPLKITYAGTAADWSKNIEMGSYWENRCCVYFTDNIIDENGLWMFEFEFDSGNAFLTKVRPFSNVANIPSVFLDCPVVAIKSQAFANTDFHQITIPSSVVTIEDSAFLKSKVPMLEIPQSVTSIGCSTFEDSDIAKIILPDSITEIPELAFAGSTASEIVIPQSIESINSRAFVGCTNLTEIKLYSSLTKIGYNAFADCGKLTLRYYGYESAWQNIDIAPDYDKGSVITLITLINTDPSGPSDPSQTEFALIYELNPDGESYTLAGYKGVYDKPNLEIDKLHEEKPVTIIGEEAFVGAVAMTKLSLPDSVTEIRYGAFYGCKKLTSINLPSSLKNIDNLAFYGCSSATEVHLPAGLEKIGVSAFSGCIGLTNVYFEGTLDNWCSITLSNTSSNPLYYAGNLTLSGNPLEKITISAETQYIDNYRFCGWNGTTVELPASLKGIGSEAFENCAKLTEIIYKGSISNWLNLSKGDYWDYSTRDYLVYCLDNTVDKNGYFLFDFEKTQGGYALVRFNGIIKNKRIPALYAGEPITEIRNGAFDHLSIDELTLTESNGGKYLGVDNEDGTPGNDYYLLLYVAPCQSFKLDTDCRFIYGNALNDCSELTGIDYGKSISDWNTIVKNDNWDAALSDYVVRCLDNILYKNGDVAFFFEETQDNKGYILSQYIGEERDLVIPDMHNDKPVVKIADHLFAENNTIISVVLPDSLKEIGELSFYRCKNLESVQLGTSLEKVGLFAFAGCESLTSITVAESNSVFVAQNNCLIKKDSHTLVLMANGTAIPSDGSVKIVGSDAFSPVHTLIELTIPDSITSIFPTFVDELDGSHGYTEIYNDYSSAFQWQIRLTKITFGGTAEKWGTVTKGLLWAYLTNLFDIYCNNNIVGVSGTKLFEFTNVDDENVTLTKYNDFIDIANIPSVYGNRAVSAIGDNAFENCSYVTTVNIPASVKSIGIRAFADCPNLLTINYCETNNTSGSSQKNLADVLDWQKIEKGSYWNSGTGNGEYRIYCKNNILSEGGNLLEYTLNDDGDSYSVKNDKDLATSIEIPSTYNGKVVNAIGETAFSGKHNLTTLILPETITSVGQSAFLGCDALKYTRNDNALYVGTTTNPCLILVKANASGITQCKISTDCKFICDDAFNGCTSLTKLIYDGTEKEWMSVQKLNGWDTDCGNFFVECQDNIFKRNGSKVFNFGLEEEIYVLNNYDSDNLLTEIIIPAENNGKIVRSIKNSVFADQTALTRVVIPEGVTTIGDNAFLQCSALTEVVIPSSVTTIGKNAFKNCNLLSLNLSANVTSIGDDAFTGCCNLAEINVDVNNAVYSSKGCCLIKIKQGDVNKAVILGGVSVQIPDDKEITEIADYALSSISLAEITIPANIKAIGKYALATEKIIYCDTVENWLKLKNQSNNDFNAVAEYTVECTDNTIPGSATSLFGYTVIDESIVITDYYGQSNTVTVPEQYNNMPVVAIGDNAFYTKRLTSVILPNTIESIGSEAFRLCRTLTSIVFKGLAYEWSGIDKGENWDTDTDEYTVFCNNNTISKSGVLTFVYELNEDHNSCTLTSYTRNESTVTIPESYSGLVVSENGIDTVYSDLTVTAIGNNVFKNEKVNLETLILPSSLTSIGQEALCGTLNLTSIIFDGTMDGWAMQINKGHQWNYDAGKEGRYSVYCNDGLLSESGSTSNIVYELTMNGSSYIYTKCYDSSLTVTIPSSHNEKAITEIAEHAFYKLIGLNSVIIPDSVTAINRGAFYDCISLMNLEIPASVTELGDAIIIGCSPSSVTVNSNNGVYHSEDNCIIETETKTLVYADASSAIPSNGTVEAIGDYAFFLNKNVSDIIIPAKIKSIGKFAFSGCEYLTRIDFKGTTLEWGVVYKDLNWNSDTGNYTINCSDGYRIAKQDNEVFNFEFTSNEESYILSKFNAKLRNFQAMPTEYRGKPITTIGESAFENNESLIEITLPKGITEIRSHAFAYCKNLNAIRLPESLVSLANDAFVGCSYIDNITVDQNNERYYTTGNCIIEKASSASSVIFGNSHSTIPTDESVSVIGNSAFAGHSDLKKLFVPGSVKNIRSEAFGQCENLTDIDYAGSAKSWLAVIDQSSTDFDAGTGDYSVYCTDATVPKGGASVPINPNEAFEFALNPDGKSYAITAYHGTSSKVTLPFEYNKMPINAIAANVFENRFELTSVYYVGKIENWCNIAFATTDSNPLYYAHNLYIDNRIVNSITVPTSVKSIGNMQFVGWYGNQITLHDKIEYIGERAFAYCRNLTDISLPVSIVEISSLAFYNCNSLKSMDLPTHITHINNSLLEGCSNIEKITVPYSVIHIGNYAFGGCSKLTEISYGGSVAYWQMMYKGVGWDNRTENFIVNCDNGKVAKDGTVISEDITYVLNPDGEGYTAIGYNGTQTAITVAATHNNGTEDLPVTAIAAYAFVNCYNLISVTVEDGIEYIGEYAFSCCTALQKLILPDSIRHIGRNAFECTPNLEYNNFGDSIDYLGNDANPYVALVKCHSESNVNINKNCKIICENAFDTPIKSIIIPDNVIKIYDTSFAYCSALTSIAVSGGNSVYYSDNNCIIEAETKTLVVGCINNADSKKSEIPKNGSVTHIGNYAFCNNTELETVYLPLSITSIGDCAFGNCSSLTKIEYGGSVDDWLKIAKSTSWKESCGQFTVICTDAIVSFSGKVSLCKNDFLLELSDDETYYTVTGYIGENGKATVPAKFKGLPVTKIAECAFYGNAILEEITISYDIVEIGSRAFGECVNLKKVTIPDTVEEIAAGTFVYCTSLATVLKPANIPIGEYAFYGCIYMP